MITREEYNKALDIVEAYHKQLFIGDVSKRFEINQKVIWDGMYYFVLEVNEAAREVLLANDRNPDHPQYNDWWVNIDEVNVY
jgi:hypothetical protein